jgi:hypothetical protein
MFDPYVQNIMAKTTMEILVKYRLTSVHAMNHGWCHQWADRITEQIPEAVKVWTDDETTEPIFGHCFIHLNGRYYDSEATNGVIDWRLLPSVLGHVDGEPADCCEEEQQVERQ